MLNWDNPLHSSSSVKGGTGQDTPTTQANASTQGPASQGSANINASSLAQFPQVSLDTAPSINTTMTASASNNTTEANSNVPVVNEAVIAGTLQAEANQPSVRDHEVSTTPASLTTHEHVAADREAESHLSNAAAQQPANTAPETATSHLSNEPLQLDSPALESLEPVKASDKRIINGGTDVNQLAPFKYPWAWEFFLNANKNHWTPLDVNMTQDVHDYHHKLNDAERHVYENVLAYLTTSDILAMRNIGLAVMEKMSAPELQIYQARQVYEEALHTWTYQHCIETIGIDQSEIYNRYRVVPALYQKIKYANDMLETVMRNDIDLTDPEQMETFVLSYAFFAAIFEGSWFYNGFTPIFSLQRRGLMRGTAEQLQYIMRDEVMHASFGIRVVKEMIFENNVQLDPKKVRNMWDRALEAETTYAHYILQTPILGYTADDHIEQFRFIANRRARQMGFEEPYPGAQNRTPWLDEQANLSKEKNFFESRVTEYQSGGLDWD